MLSSIAIRVISTVGTRHDSSNIARRNITSDCFLKKAQCALTILPDVVRFDHILSGEACPADRLGREPPGAPSGDLAQWAVQSPILPHRHHAGKSVIRGRVCVRAQVQTPVFERLKQARRVCASFGTCGSAVVSQSHHVGKSSKNLSTLSHLGGTRLPVDWSLLKPVLRSLVHLSVWLRKATSSLYFFDTLKSFTPTCCAT